MTVVDICVTVIIVAIIVAVVIILCNKAARKTVSEIAIKFITEAEEKFGDGTGELKLQYAVAGIVSAIPKWLSVIFPTSKIIEIINEQVDKFNDFMKDKDLTITKIPDYIKSTEIQFVTEPEEGEVPEKKEESTEEVVEPVVEPAPTEGPGAMD